MDMPSCSGPAIWIRRSAGSSTRPSSKERTDMRKVWVIFLLAALSGLALLPMAGCGKPDDGMSQEQLQKADRLNAIAKKADGDWEKVSQADREYILKEVLHGGNEQSARMLLMAKAGKLRGNPSGSAQR